jgi:hypothetical protein
MGSHGSPAAEVVEDRNESNQRAKKRAKTEGEEPSPSSSLPSSSTVVTSSRKTLWDIPEELLIHALSYLDDPSGRFFKRTSCQNKAVVDLYHKEFFDSFGNNRFIPLPNYRALLVAPILRRVHAVIWELVGSTSPAIQRVYIDDRVSIGETQTIAIKYEGLSTGVYGYNNPAIWDNANAFIDQEAELRRHPSAIRWKYEGLYYGRYGYTKSLVKAHEFIDAEIRANNPEAVRLKMYGLILGSDGYEKDLPALRTLIEEQVVLGNNEAISAKIEGLDRGENGYKRNHEALRDFINAQAALGNSHAIIWKMRGLEGGKFGFPQDPVALNTLIEEQIILKYPHAIGWKAEGLSKGIYGFPEDPAAAKTLIEREIALGNRKAIKWKDEGLCHGLYGFSKDLMALKAFRAAYPLDVDMTILTELFKIDDESLPWPGSPTTRSAKIEYLRNLGDPLLTRYLTMFGSVERIQAIMAARVSAGKESSASATPANADSSGSSSKEQEAVTT